MRKRTGWDREEENRLGLIIRLHVLLRKIRTEIRSDRTFILPFIHHPECLLLSQVSQEIQVRHSCTQELQDLQDRLDLRLECRIHRLVPVRLRIQDQVILSAACQDRDRQDHRVHQDHQDFQEHLIQDRLFRQDLRFHRLSLHRFLQHLQDRGHHNSHRKSGCLRRLTLQVLKMVLALELGYGKWLGGAESPG